MHLNMPFWVKKYKNTCKDYEFSLQNYVNDITKFSNYARQYYRGLNLSRKNGEMEFDLSNNQPKGKNI